MIVAISISPSGAADENGSVSAAVADAVRVIRDSGLPYELNSMFTNIEGEWQHGDMRKGARDACCFLGFSERDRTRRRVGL